MTCWYLLASGTHRYRICLREHHIRWFKTSGIKMICHGYLPLSLLLSLIPFLFLLHVSHSPRCIVRSQELLSNLSHLVHSLEVFLYSILDADKPLPAVRHRINTPNRINYVCLVDCFGHCQH